MTQRKRLLAVTTALSLSAAGLGYYASSDPSSGGQRAANLLGSKGCDVTIQTPTVDATGVSKISAGQSLAVTVIGKALRCPAGTVSVYAAVNGAAESLLGTATVSAAGLWSYGPTTLTDNATTVLRAAMSVTVADATRATEARVTVDAATARPRVVLTTPAPDPGGRVRIVAPAADGGCGGGGNPRAEKGEPGYYHDLSCAAGGQVSPALTVYGASPGTLTVAYGVTPLASVSVTTDPQTFTEAELGAWTLDDWARDDLVVRAAKDGDAGVDQVVLDLQVSTGSPPTLPVTVTTVNQRHADFDVAFTLPSTPAPVARPTIEVSWTTSTRRATANISLGTVSVGQTPVVMPTVPESCAQLLIGNSAVADASVPAWCDFNADPSTDGGHKVPAAYWNGFGWTPASEAARVDQPDAGWTILNECGRQEIANAPVYCVAPAGTASLTATAAGCCAEFTNDWLATRQTSNGITFAPGERVVSCWGDGTDTSDAGVSVQLWRCADGRQYRGGETYTEHVLRQPPLNTYYIHAQVIW